jgi:radical SAM superfamily enzyme YgiQ (UPF0313 family)
MLALVEPCMAEGLLDRPSLGCAMVMAACRKAGIKTTLIKGQTRTLRDMFVRDSEELWDLIRDLPPGELKRLGMGTYREAMEEKGLPRFRNELAGLYRYFMTDKSLLHFMNAPKLHEFTRQHRIFISLLHHYAGDQDRPLKIVDRYVGEILRDNPAYVAFSLDSFDPVSRRVRKRIKESTQIPIVAGGPVTPFLRPRDLAEVFDAEAIDYLVIGPGDHSLPRLLETLEEGKEPRGVPNVFYKRNGTIRGNRLEAVRDLNSLPFPDFTQFDLDLYWNPVRLLPLQTVRGCGWRKCAFCNYHRIAFGTHRASSLERTIDTIRHLQTTYGCSHFAFHDDAFHPDRAKEISQALVKNGPRGVNRPSFSAYARLEEGFNDTRLLSLMRKAGFSLILWGMESGCQRVLDRMQKGTQVSTMGRILEKSSKNKMLNLCMVFFGFPGETREEAQDTVRFLKDHSRRIDFLDLQTFHPTPFSSVARHPRRWGVKMEKDGRYSSKSGMTPEETGRFYAEIMERVQWNSLKLTSNKIRHYHLISLYYQLLPAILFSRLGVLSSRAALRRLARESLAHIHPLILGEMKEENGQSAFYPWNVKESYLINKIHPPRTQRLGPLEREAGVLSDGEFSIEEVIRSLSRTLTGIYPRKEIRRKCLDFYTRGFSGNWVWGLKKSTRTLRLGGRRERRREGCKKLVQKDRS